MPDPHTIPFREADGNGHYNSKQLPQDKTDFLEALGLPAFAGDVVSASETSVSGQVATFWGEDGHTIKTDTQTGLAKLAGGVLNTVPAPVGAVVGTTDVQTLSNKTIDNAVFIGTMTGLGPDDVGLGNVDNTSDANKPISSATAAELANKEDKAKKGVTNGYASLDAVGKVPMSQIPDAVVGASVYQGTWNAATNSPTIPAAAPANTGFYYNVAVGGSTNIDGISTWVVGDTIISNGSIWQKIPAANAVQSVNGKQGVVVINKNDVGLGNVDNTSDATKNSAAATLTNKTINGANNSLTVRLDADVTNNLPVSRLDSGAAASAATFWRGDGHWVSPAGSGDVVGPGSSTTDDIAAFSGTTGKLLKTSGKNVNDVITGPASSTDGQIALFNGSTGKALRAALATGLVTVSSGVASTVAAPAGAVVGTSDVQTLSNKTLVDPVNTVAGYSFRCGGVLVCNAANVTTTAPNSGTDIFNIVIPANMLSRDGDTLRITLYIYTGTNPSSKIARIFWGGANVYSIDNTTTTSVEYMHTVFITRFGAANQRITAMRTTSATNANAETSTATATLSTSTQLRAEVWANATGAAASRLGMVEFLPVP